MEVHQVFKFSLGMCVSEHAGVLRGREEGLGRE